MHEDEHWQGCSRKDKFLSVHINLLIEVINYYIWAMPKLLMLIKFKFCNIIS